MTDARTDPGTELEQLDHDDFRERPLAELAGRTGLTPPDDPGPDEEEAWREKAWRSYRTDIENRDEWGTAMQATEPPRGEEPEL